MLRRLASRAGQFKPRLGQDFSVNAETLRCSLWIVYPKEARCETLGRFGTCGVWWAALLVWSAFLLSLAPECRLEGRGKKTLGH